MQLTSTVVAVATQTRRKIQRTIALRNPRIPPRRGRAGLLARFVFALGLLGRFTVALDAAGLALPRYLFSATRGRLRLDESLMYLGLLAYCFAAP
jgi:hypothetical protein